MLSTKGAVGAETRIMLAKKAFSHTAEYDGAISNYLTSLSMIGEKQAFPDKYSTQLTKVMDLRYGENPHQEAASTGMLMFLKARLQASLNFKEKNFHTTILVMLM
jgi:AICAR transformylase/IMP cyclohydrolase PurH